MKAMDIIGTLGKASAVILLAVLYIVLCLPFQGICWLWRKRFEAMLVAGTLFIIAGLIVNYTDVHNYNAPVYCAIAGVVCIFIAGWHWNRG